jgi:hypothetical protein
MLELIILAAVVAATAGRIDSINDTAIARAKAKGTEPKFLSFTNPFHWVGTFIGMAGFGVGYSPKLVSYMHTEYKVLHTEAKIETVVAGVETEKAFKSQKAVGRKVSNDHFDAKLTASRDNLAKLQAALAELQA